MVGIAVETIVPSMAAIKVVIKIASVTIRTRLFFSFFFTSSLYLLLMRFQYNSKQILCFICLFPMANRYVRSTKVTVCGRLFIDWST